MKNPEKTLHWIVGILNRHNVPFVVTGGLAGKIYGSPRPLNDIDIDIHDKDFSLIIEDIRPYIVYGPERHIDERWDLLLATLIHEGQEIDISGADSIRICDARTGIWHDAKTDFEKAENREFLGLPVPIIAREDFITYKSRLAGDHQKVDIEAARNIQS